MTTRNQHDIHNKTRIDYLEKVWYHFQFRIYLHPI